MRRASSVFFVAALTAALATAPVHPSLMGPARADTGTQSRESSTPAATGIEPVWKKAVAGIEAKLKAALELYKSGKTEQAKKAVTAAQFEGYKNSLMETAVRRHVSQRRDFQNSERFTEIVTFMSQGEPAAKIEESIAKLSKSLEEDLPNLRLVEGAVPKEMLEEARKRIPEKDWRKVSQEVDAAIGGAVGMYAQGKTMQAAELARDAYFENYDESGLEAKIDSVSHDANMRLGMRFSTLVRQMDAGEPPERIEQTREELKTELQEAVAGISRGVGDSAAGWFQRVSNEVQAWFR
jgi:high-affinity iron transporter